MRNRKDYYAVSVESRKGGVGKTSAALNFARSLIDTGKGDTRKYEVVFLDLDITGTASVEMAKGLRRDTHIWEDHLRIPHAPRRKGEKADTQLDRKDIDLVTLFQEYMTGEPAPEAVWGHEEDSDQEGVVALSLGKINIISSILRPSSARDAGSGLFYAPDVLFDEMHSEWFVNMIKDFLSNCLVSLRKADRKKKLVLVIDNAPGYSGLVPAVNQWLTDIGPECGKFLFVCTLDNQDIQECLETMHSVHCLYRDKWEISRGFLRAYTRNAKKKDEAKKKGEAEKKDEDESADNKVKKIDWKSKSQDQKAFLAQLVESIPDDYTKCSYPDSSGSSEEKHPQCTKCGCCFYRMPDAKTGDEDKVNGQDFVVDSSKYVALIINKVPDRITPEVLAQFPISDLLKDAGPKDERLLTLGGISERLKEIRERLKESEQDEEVGILPSLEDCHNRMIPFKDIYSYQFISLPWLKGADFGLSDEESDGVGAETDAVLIAPERQSLIKGMQYRKRTNTRIHYCPVKLFEICCKQNIFKDL